jgi:hypothetical protein
VLFFEALVVALFIVPALTLVEGHHGLILWGGLGVVAACLVAAGLLRTRAGYVLGSVVQLAVVGAGFVLPVMFGLGLVFAGLWVAAILVARRAEAVRAQAERAALRSAEDGPVR